MKILLLLTPLFLLVGGWLFYYSSRRSRMLQEFSAKLGLVYQSADDGRLERQLNCALQLEAPLGRDFSRIKDLADADGIQLFRVTEALDLSPYGLPQNSHFGRIAVSFSVASQAQLFFLARGSKEFRPIVPNTVAQTADIPEFQCLQQLISSFPPPHTLSLTLMRGRLLAYLERLVTGSEKEPELSYLLEFAQHARRKLRS